MVIRVAVVFDRGQKHIDLDVKVIEVVNGDRLRDGRKFRAAELVLPMMAEHDVLQRPSKPIGKRLAPAAFW